MEDPASSSAWLPSDRSTLIQGRPGLLLAAALARFGLSVRRLLKVIRWQADPDRRAGRGPRTGSGAAAEPSDQSDLYGQFKRY